VGEGRKHDSHRRDGSETLKHYGNGPGWWSGDVAALFERHLLSDADIALAATERYAGDRYRLRAGTPRADDTCS
jgi:hypothetical protein